MFAFVLAASTPLFHAALTDPCACSICAAWNTAPSFMSRPRRMRRVSKLSSPSVTDVVRPRSRGPWTHSVSQARVPVQCHQEADRRWLQRLLYCVLQVCLLCRGVIVVVTHSLSTASPHDSHLIATFAQDSKVVRILDHRQPGQALLELHGHAANINSIEWSPNRRGVLASGADDSQVLSWDLMNPQNAAPITSNGTGGPKPESANTQMKGPAGFWRSDFEVTSISWAPPSQLTEQGADWLGVVGGRGVWGVKLGS